MTDALQQQIEANFKAFYEMLPSLITKYKGKFALMKDGQIIEFFDTARDAYIAGQKIFGDDHPFSIQEVTEVPIDLGYFSHALPKR